MENRRSIKVAKGEYQDLEIEVVEFDAEDAITTSGGDDEIEG